MHEMRMRRSVHLDDIVERGLHTARGYLMSQEGVDVDITQSINFFLFLGIMRYRRAMQRDGLFDSEKEVFKELTRPDPKADRESILDKIITMKIHRDYESNAEEFKTKKSVVLHKGEKGAVKAG